VTNPQRFAPLHNLAAELLDRLEREFDVERMNGPGLDPELEEHCKAAQPSISLVPRDVGAAPLTVVFTAFPGLYVRFGRWCTMAFPTCGCDACDETIESEAERLKSMIEDLIEGRFREATVMPAGGGAWLESEFWESAPPRAPCNGLSSIKLVPKSYVAGEIRACTGGSPGSGGSDWCSRMRWEPEAYSVQTAGTTKQAAETMRNRQFPRPPIYRPRRPRSGCEKGSLCGPEAGSHRPGLEARTNAYLCK
jgi:hypothetical protein